MLNVYGSGKPAAHMMANSATSMRVLNSHGHGTRNGFSGRYRSRLGTRVSCSVSTRSGYGWPENTSTVCPSAVSSRANSRV